MSENAEGNVEEFAHNGGANSEVMEFTTFQDCDPRLEGFAPTPSDRRWQIKGFAQEGVADFGKVSFAIKIATRTPFCRSQAGIGSQLPGRLEFFSS